MLYIHMPRKKFANKKRPLRKRARKGHRHPRMDRVQTLRVRAPGVVCPDRTMCKLNYLDTTNQQMGSVAANVASVQYIANGGFTLNPIGWSEMAAMYRYYRIRGTAINVMGSNMEAFPITVFIVPTNVAYSSTLAHAQQLFQNAFCKRKLAAPKGGNDRFFLKSFISTRKLVGSNQTMVDDMYTNITSSNPPNLWYWYFYAMPTDSADSWTANNGVRFTTRLTLYVEFYERNILSA